MKNYYVKQKVFSLLDQYKIFDRNQNALYQCKRKAFSIGGKIEFIDLKTESISFIMKKKLFRFLPTYTIIDSNEEEMALVHKRFSLFKGKVDVQSKYGNFHVEGNFINHQFNIYKETMVVASVTKQWLSWGDTYEISVEEDENQELMVALVVLIDRLFHTKSAGIRRYR